MVCVIVVRSERRKGEEKDGILIESFSIIYPFLRYLLSCAELTGKKQKEMANMRAKTKELAIFFKSFFMV